MDICLSAAQAGSGKASSTSALQSIWVLSCERHARVCQQKVTDTFVTVIQGLQIAAHSQLAKAIEKKFHWRSQAAFKQR